MPDDFLLRNINNQDVWVSETPNEILEIKEASHVRIRVANVQLQPEKLVRSAHMAEFDSLARSHCVTTCLCMHWGHSVTQELGF